MAVKVLTVAAAKQFDTGVLVTPETATVAADGFEATIDGDIIILAENVAAGADYDITVKFGTAMQGIADLVVTIARSTSQIIKINTGVFKNISGASKGKILIVVGHVDLHVKVIEV